MVWTGAGDVLAPGTVAIEGDRIVAVERGVAPHLMARAGEVVDLAGRTLIPAFQDAHVHPTHGGLRRIACDLTEGADAPEAYAAAVGDYARSHPEAAWITGGGWHMPHFPGGVPRRETLDDVVPDRPVFLVNTDGHGAWVNSRALELAGVTADTADPRDGRIERDADGSPTGTLHEGAMDLVGRHVPGPGPSDLVVAIEDAQRHLHGLGITAWTDACVVPEELGAYQALADVGRLSARVTAALWWDRHRGLEQIEDLVAQRVATRGDRLTASTVKIMQDGVVENGTAAMLDPYFDLSGAPTDNRGLSYLAPDLLDQAVVRLDEAGFDVHVHAIGDRAVREALDAFAAARRVGDGRRRHTIAHVQVVHPDDLPRFAALGVVVNAQPLWAQHEPQMTELTLPVLGPERSGWQYPWAGLLRSGAPLAFGSDWPVSSPDPLQGIAVAVARRGPDTPPDAGPFLPDQRLTLDEALTAATRGSAYLHHLDDRTGTIATGMAADLAVVGAPLFGDGACPPGDTEVVLTMVGGRIVHRTGVI